MRSSRVRRRVLAAGRGVGLVGAVAACATAPPPAAGPRGDPAAPAALAAPTPSAAGRWASAVQSPHPTSPAVEPALTRRCGAPDAALGAVAARLAGEHARGEAELDTARVSFELRAAGAPYAWPRVFTLTGAALDTETAAPPLERWLASFDDGGERRCGLGRATDAQGATHLVAVVADVLADFAALPVRARAGAWLRLEAELLVPAATAKVVLLGPRGRPRPVPTSLVDGHASAAFALAEPGQWLVQLLADTATGPRPVGEALVHADVTPPDEYVATAVPGEAAAHGATAPPRALAAMIDAARASEGLARLDADPELGALATAHAEAMRAAGRLGHDVGHGDLVARLAAADLAPHVAGENVARARDVTRAHRALWQSPSHRATLLDDRYDAVGVGLVEDPDGTTWVCEVFAQR